jgi:biotin carboxyl carrier protein
VKSYTVIVNGKSYDIDVAEKGRGDVAKSTTPPPIAVTPPTAPSPSVVLKAPPIASEGGTATKVVSPMPGKIISLKVSVGDNVRNGQELVIMEAMKMHNPILASKDGTVKEIYVKKGDPVQSGMTIMLIG